MSTTLILLTSAAIFIAGYSLITFNKLIALRNACGNARAGIDVNLKRRHQLIPNLVAAVQGYTSHERITLSAVTESRSVAITQLGKANSATAEQTLEGALLKLTARIEAYPDLKADGLFTNLMKNLTEAEEQISASRRAFNAQVMRMNNLVQQFPSLLLAKLAGFNTLAFYSADAVALDAPAVILKSSSAGG